ncbi:MAG TPA: AAA family ATPase [Dehalococcoidia bacterium]|nr:AAA family ATPase [Dehalococcoidia bacterium]
MAQTLPGGTVTIMFTDLVGSAALGDRVGDIEAQALRRAHDRILRQQFQRSCGNVIKSTGDGFLVAFESARQAVECGVEVQRAIQTQQAEGRYRELQIRVGLHTGEPVVEGGDLRGTDVDLAARICDQAAGGQVLISDVSRVLASRSPELEFKPLGERTLKGFSQAVSLFEVRRPEERTVRPSLTRFTGREEETALLRSHLEEAVRGRGRLVLVAGEPGVGKTRLVSELAVYAADRGLEVLSGRAYETEGMPPYLPFTEPLARYAQSRSPDELRSALDGNGPYLARLLPDLHRLLPELEEPPTLSPEGERYRLFESVSDFLLKSAQAKPVLLHLDDLHWADEASQLLLQHLAPRLAEGPLLVVGSYRDTEAEPLASLLAELRRQRLGTTISLRPFGSEEASSLLQAILGEPAAPQAAQALFTASEGNPFFTEELVWHLREQEVDLSAPAQTVDAWEIPEGVRQVIAGRLARLSGEANRLLAYSSVLGRDLSLRKVAAVTDRDDIGVLDLLEEAVASYVLREAPEGYAFAHPLIRETLYQGLTATRRRQLHRRTAEALEALYGADLEPQQLVELAHHFFQTAAKGEDVDKAIAYATRAAERALSQAAWEEAARLYQMALRALDLKNKPDEHERCELLLALGDARVKAGQLDEARVSFLTAADVARKLGAAQKLAVAALGVPERVDPGTTDETMRELLEEALNALPEEDSAARAKLLARLAALLYWQPGSEELRELLSREAVEIARRVKDPLALGFVLDYRSAAIAAPGNVEERLELAAEVMRLGREYGDARLAFHGHDHRSEDLMELGDIRGAIREIESKERFAREIREPLYLGYFTRGFRAMIAILEGRFEEADRLIQQSQLDRQTLLGGAENQFLGAQIFTLRNQRGQLNLNDLAAVAHFASLYPAVPAWRAALAFIHSELGNHAEAGKELEYIGRNEFADLPWDMNWLTAVTLLSEVCCFVDDKTRATTLYDLLLPYARRNVVIGGQLVCLGPVSRFLALLAATLRRWDDAERHFKDALAMNQRMGARPFVARTQHDYAKMMLARRAPGDRRKAYALLKEALEAAREMGMKSLEERALKLLESRKGLVPKYPDGLSRREVEVLRLIAVGKSSGQIAEQLYLSPRTVERHISNIYGKINARSRAEATSYALANGLVSLPHSAPKVQQ